MSYCIGIDEVGRGPVAGPVVVCACAIKQGVDIISFFPQQKLQDSKKLSEKNRREILEKIQLLIVSKDIFFGVGEVSAIVIDDIGISPSIKQALALALASLHEQGIPLDTFIFLDGSLHAPATYQQETIIKGDEKIPEIALASIYAKEFRDALMRDVAKKYPHYHFESHVGYGTAAHYEAIKKIGLTDIHRKSFLKRLVS